MKIFIKILGNFVLKKKKPYSFKHKVYLKLIVRTLLIRKSN